MGLLMSLHQYEHVASAVIVQGYTRFSFTLTVASNGTQVLGILLVTSLTCGQ